MSMPSHPYFPERVGSTLPGRALRWRCETYEVKGVAGKYPSEMKLSDYSLCGVDGSSPASSLYDDIDMESPPDVQGISSQQGTTYDPHGPQDDTLDGVAKSPQGSESSESPPKEASDTDEPSSPGAGSVGSTQSDPSYEINTAYNLGQCVQSVDDSESRFDGAWTGKRLSRDYPGMSPSAFILPEGTAVPFLDRQGSEKNREETRMIYPSEMLCWPDKACSEFLDRDDLWFVAYHFHPSTTSAESADTQSPFSVAFDRVAITPIEGSQGFDAKTSQMTCQMAMRSVGKQATGTSLDDLPVFKVSATELPGEWCWAEGRPYGFVHVSVPGETSSYVPTESLKRTVDVELRYLDPASAPEE